ncbi:hypothetical protein ACRRTK_000005 [Alexandromys fortis]
MFLFFLFSFFAFVCFLFGGQILTVVVLAGLDVSLSTKLVANSEIHLPLPLKC